MTEPKPIQEGEGALRVDLRWRGLQGQIAAYLLSDGDGLAVIEPGPGSTLPVLLDAIGALGRSAEDVTHILVTHVHLDHAGAAARLASMAPRARVHVHPRGAAHLVDPSRLLASAARIYGDRMEPLWGAMDPLPAERMRILEDGDEVVVGTRRLRAVDTPGHAWHHHAYHEPDAALLFGGDVTGIRLAGAPYVRPPTPPPDLHVPAWLESLARIRRLRPSRLLPTHFGGSTDVEWHLEELERRLLDWRDWASGLIAAGAGIERLAAELERKAHLEVVDACGSVEAARAYEEAVPSAMLAAGLFRHLGSF